MAANLQDVEKYVAYLDILGFREMLRTENFKKRISEIVTVLEERTEFDQSHHPDLNYLAISDTIVVCAPKGHAPNLLWKISQVQNALLLNGFCVRGGVAFGQVLLHGGNPTKNIFGPTLVNAYSIEAEHAIYPRVVIDSVIVDEIRREFLQQNKKSEVDFLLQDADGCYFVNQFGRDTRDAASGHQHRKQKALKNRALYERRVAAGLKSANTKAKMKWFWLERQLREQFKPYV